MAHVLGGRAHADGVRRDRVEEHVTDACTQSPYRCNRERKPVRVVGDAGGDRCNAQQREEERNRPQVSGADASYRSGNRVLADLLGGLLGGSVIGYAIGFFTGTNPWGLLVGLFLGIVVAFRNIIRAANRRPDE